MNLTHGQGQRCALFALHPNLRMSQKAICFECAHFHQEIGEDGVSAWTLDFDDQGDCLVGQSNDEN